MNEIRVLLVDDHGLVRDMLGSRLESESDLHVVATAPNAELAIDEAISHRPDIVLMDIDMPGLVCFDAARRINTLLPEVRFIFLSAFAQDHYIEQALDVGALGYVSKGEPPEKVVAAIRAVAANRAYFSSGVQDRIVFDGDRARLGTRRRSRVSTLTPREIEVLRYVARGMTKKAVAGMMHVSPKTVDRHTYNLMNKLDIHDRVELARFAIREGLAEA